MLGSSHYPLPEGFCEVYERDLVSLVSILQPTFRTLNCHSHPGLTVKKPQTLVLP